MSVVLRCPNCGTTQAAAGECQACHEAQVRYYCTNHEPGIWLTGPTCPQCAAAPSPRPTSPRPTAPRPTIERERERVRVPDEETFDLGPSRPALWEKVLRGAVLARGASPPAVVERERDAASLGPASGWLLRLVFRLVLIGVAVVVALVVAVYWLASSMN